jgi:hypothetical protein
LSGGEDYGNSRDAKHLLKPKIFEKLSRDSAPSVSVYDHQRFIVGVSLPGHPVLQGIGEADCAIAGVDLNRRWRLRGFSRHRLIEQLSHQPKRIHLVIILARREAQ